MKNLPIDLWTRLAESSKPILLYGMGNGADKILNVAKMRQIPIEGFFASDGFVRGHSFHGKEVLSFSRAKEIYGDFIVLLAFGSNLPHMLDLFESMDASMEFYVPDVPLAGNTLFDTAFVRAHEQEFDEVRELLADEESKLLYDAVIESQLCGSIAPLKDRHTLEDDIWKGVLHPQNYRVCADLGAYNGDSIRSLLSVAPSVERIEAFEPDRRSFRKLTDFISTAGLEGMIHAHNAGAWNTDTELVFSAQGNRNSSVYGQVGGTVTQMLCLDHVLNGDRLDYLKMDVEGAESEALEGSAETIRSWKPEIRLSLYHRSEDLFALPLQLHEICPEYRLILRRPRYIPAWDLCLYATVDEPR